MVSGMRLMTYEYFVTLNWGASGHGALGGGGAPALRVGLEDHRARAALGQVGPGHEAVVATADHDRVVLVRHHASLAAGSPAPRAGVRGCASTPASKARRVSARHASSWAAHTNHGSRESGSHRMPSSMRNWARVS